MMFGRYFNRLAASMIRSRACSEITPPLKARDTADLETPATRATSVPVGGRVLMERNARSRNAAKAVGGVSRLGRGADVPLWERFQSSESIQDRESFILGHKR